MSSSTSDPYRMTGFQSACSEYAEKALSLDERYLSNGPATFIIEIVGESPSLSIRKGDRLIIDRSLVPKEGQIVLLVVKNEFMVSRFSKQLLLGHDPETEDFVWGVVTTLLREFK